MRASVKITVQAWRDLDEIVDYIAKENPDAAERFGNQLLETAHSLEKAPMMGAFVKGQANVRMIVCHPYLIFYRLNLTESRLEILRFWHGARSRTSLHLDK